MVALVARSTELSLLEKIDAREARKDFRLFVQLAWHVIEPGRPFVAGWHLDAIAEHLMAVSRGEIKRLLVNMPPRHGKPLYNSSMILMSNGSRKPISDIRIGEYVITDKGRPRQVTDVIDQGMLPCVKITTDHGRSVIAALDHPFLTPDGWIKAGDLRVGMTLANVASPDTEACQSDRKLEEFRLAGYFIGDGNVNFNGQGNGCSAMITTGDPLIAEDLYHCAETLGFTLIDRGYNRKSGIPVNARRYNFSGGIRKWLRGCDIAGKTSYTKRVPDWVFQGSDEQIAHFIAAYFVCDGSINQKSGVRADLCAEIYSVSRELLEDVQHLYLRLGIQSRIAKKSSRYKGEPYTSYRLSLNSQDDLARFKKVIPLLGERMRKLSEWEVHRRQFDSSLLPDAIVSIEDAGVLPCSCITVEEDHTYTVNDLVCHNSSLISVLWTTWLLLNTPSIRLLCSSYAMNLATRDNLKSRRLIKSPWFQARYGNQFELTKDQDAKIKFETDQFGYRMATSVGASATGEGGDTLILDDAHNIDEKESDAKREAAIDWFDNTWSTRLNDQQTGAMVVVGQRIHQQDVSGHILETNDGEWVHLNLPAEYDPGSACRTYLPSGKEFWADPRTQEGELLWNARFPQTVIEKAKRRHGPLGYSALYGQRPVPPGGYIFQAQYERLFTIDPNGFYLLQTPEGVRPVRFVDCALHITSDVAAKAKEQSDYTVFCVWAVTPRKEVVLLHVFRDHLVIPRQVEEGYKTYLAYNDSRFQAFWFEDVAYQGAIGQFLIEKGVPCLPFYPQGQGDKVLRAGGASIWMRLGNVYFLANAAWLEDWRKELYLFPKDAHDDQVDNLSMMCLIVKQAVDVEALDTETAEAISGWRGW